MLMWSWVRNGMSAIISVVLLLVFLGGSGSLVSAGNVLVVFPFYGFSHFKVLMPILNELSSRGHNLTVISFVKNPHADEFPNYEELLISAPDKDQSNTTINLVPLTKYIPTRNLEAFYTEYRDLYRIGQNTCDQLYSSGHVQTVLKRHQEIPYDLLLTELFNTDCPLAIAKVLNLPIIGLSTSALMPYYYDRIDLPDTPSFVQSEYIGYAEPLSWTDRLFNFCQAKLLKLLYRYHSNRKDNAVVKKYLNIDVDVDEVARTQTAFVLVNQHFSLMGSRPQTRQFVEVGGVHITSQAKQEIPMKIAQFLDQSDQGIIFISWGSMVRASSMDPEKLEAIIKVLEQQPLRVIFKWEGDVAPQVDTKKFLLVKWAPQLALLCHPKVELFWTHGGLLGTTEAVHCGTKMLVTPIYGDQYLNAYAVQNRGMGLKLDYHDINVQTLSDALKELSKPSYAVRARKISQIFEQRERSPLESAVWSVEYVIEHGLLAAEILQSPGIKLNWFVYHSLDSLTVILIVIAILMTSSSFICRGKLSDALKLQGKRHKRKLH
ncbi:UDP-glucosyltransferase 2-like [Drosophila tropicalis]|uniref:UDP-glucosyltransferase 2-like n=1 Tax=Drosophila tropicalis TaxID=46794 RepID=UPI0035ABF711